MSATSSLVAQSATALDTIMRSRKVKSDREVADLIPHLSREMLQKRRKGGTPMTVVDIDELARVLRVPPDLFLRSEIEIYSWFSEHGDEWKWAARDSNPEPAGLRSRLTTIRGHWVESGALLAEAA